MKLYPIDASKLKRDTHKKSLWFMGDSCELHIIFSKNEIVVFDITIDDKHIEGGYERSLKFGYVTAEDEGEIQETHYKASRLVQYKEEINSEELIQHALELIDNCTDLEEQILLGIKAFLSSKGQNRKGLYSDRGFMSFSKN